MGKKQKKQISFHWRLSHGHVVWSTTPPLPFHTLHTHFILCNGFQCVSKPSTIPSMPQCYLMPVYQLCLFQSLFSETIIVIKVSVRNWKLICHTALLWVAFGMRGIYKAAPRTMWIQSWGWPSFPRLCSKPLHFPKAAGFFTIFTPWIFLWGLLQKAETGGVFTQGSRHIIHTHSHFPYFAALFFLLSFLNLNKMTGLT